MEFVWLWKCSSRCWTYLQIEWPGGGDLYDIISSARRDFRRSFFIEVVIICCWNIWKQRNDFIFDGLMPSFRSWKYGFKEDVALLMHRVKPAVADALKSWMRSLL
ncbi:hypothetical protein BRADI_5g11197v3 [Brachypodium distachyon]|uniref:Uncharacterized protein n=1 Tax=Brachypodium distachyon TaxID=15368 RepID=A0A2K2CGM8_BRADI|nr:hypothetical protein BRADI_5g11197v3 [Brachypodium distachyon]